MIRAHQKLKAWQVAMRLVEDIYRLTGGFPPIERYGLATQMQRAAVSVPSNLAEGAARSSSREFRRYLLMARGSLAELETQLQLSDRLGYCQNRTEIMNVIERLYGLLNGLIRKHEP